MSGRFMAFLFVLAILTTAATYAYTAETQETLSNPGLTDLEQRATVHGWPWGYYAEVTELVRYTEQRVIVIEYTELRFESLVQSLLAWFVAWLVILAVGLMTLAPRQR
jgi:hypothetical protein